MLRVKCTANTCIYYKEGMCNADEIELIDFEYYQDIKGYEQDISEDDMKCITYKSIYSRD